MPMEMMKRLLDDKGLHSGGDVPRRALGRRARRAVSSGCCSTPARAARTRSITTRTRCAACTRYRQPSLYFPTPGGTFAGESLPGEMTWARAYITRRRALDGHRQGRGREAAARGARRVVGRHDAPVAVHGGRHGHLARHADGALPVEPRRRRVRRRLRRDGRALARSSASACASSGTSDSVSAASSSSASTWARAACARASSTRAARCRRKASHEIETWRPREDFVEQSSEDIWRAAGVAIRGALAAGAARARAASRGIGFDATCSLVALDDGDAPVTVSPTGRGRAERDRVDGSPRHRASRSASTDTQHEVLRYVGGVISPEMETPKLLWLKEHLPESLATRRAISSICPISSATARPATTRARSARPSASGRTWATTAAGAGRTLFFEQIGLGELARRDFARIGSARAPDG